MTAPLRLESRPRAPLGALGQFELPDPGDLVPFGPSKTNPFECGPCESFDFNANRCVRSDAPPPEGCPGQQVWDPTVCLCVEPGTQAQQKPSSTATTGVGAGVVLGTVALVAGALYLAARAL